MAEPSYTSADFHNAVQRRLVDAAIAVLADSKLDWKLVEPLLDAARSVCRADIESGGIELHAASRRDGDLVEAEEAWITLVARDRESGEEWLTKSWWLSEAAAAGADPERLRAAIAGLERTIARLRSRLAEMESEAG